MNYYIAVYEFADMHDGGFVYHPGDVFPRMGVEVSEERINALKSYTNRIGLPLIKEVGGQTAARPEKAPEKPETVPKSRRRKAKTE